LFEELGHKPIMRDSG